MTTREPTGPRNLLIVATSRYSDPDVWPDLDLSREIGVWTEWLTDRALGSRAFTVELGELADSPTKKQVDAALEQWDGFDRNRGILVCYITGHGEQHNREHRLVLSSSTPGWPSSMLATRQVLEWLRDRFDNALVVVDTCYAGDVAALLSTLDDDLPDGWIVIASASAHQYARVGALTNAVQAFVDGGATDPGFPFLQFGDLFKTLSTALRGQRWKFLTTPLEWTERPAYFPNRHYSPDVDERVQVAPARQDVAMLASDVVAHWDPRSRGVADASTPGVLFTGRDRLMAALVEAARGEPGAFVVTGSAGCGKSAVLSRLVTLSDPGFRSRYPEAIDAPGEDDGSRPRPGDVDVAVLAKGLVAQSALDAIRERFGIPAVSDESIEETLLRIHGVRSKLRVSTLVVDALDEAEDPRGILSAVLAPLVRHPDAPWLRLLVGVRGTVSATRDPIDKIDDSLASVTIRALDALPVDAGAPPYWSSVDLAEYVQRLLRTPVDTVTPTPYSTALDVDVRRLAQAVSETSGTSYVLARLISDQLRRRLDRQDPDDMVWRRASGASLADIIEAELESDYSEPARREVVRHLLAAASLARGRGVPRRSVWPSLARALDPTGREYSDDDISALIGYHIGGYLIRDTAENATVYRPFHDAFAAAMTQGIELAAKRRATQALFELSRPTRDHGYVVPPTEYLRRHLVEHAAESSDLDTLIADPDFLTWADPDHVIPLLDRLRSDDARAVGRIYRTVAHSLRGLRDYPDTFPLQLRAAQAGLATLVAGLAGTAPIPSWRPRWATPRQDSDHQRIDTTIVTGVAVTELRDGTPVIVSGGWDEAVCVWRLTDGNPVSNPIEHDALIESVATGALRDGTPVVASAGQDGTVRVWRLDDGAPVGVPLRAHGPRVTALAIGTSSDGDPVMVSASRDHTLRIWRLQDGMPLVEPLRGHTGPVTTVALGSLRDGTPVVVSGSEDETLRIWRLADGAPLGEPLRGHTGSVTSLSIGAVGEGEVVIVSASRDRTVRVWRLDGGDQLGSPIRHEGPVDAVVVGALRDRTPVAVSGSMDKLHVWRLADGFPVRSPMSGHDGLITSLAFATRRDGERVVVSGSDDKTLRVWGLDDAGPVGTMWRGHDGRVQSLAVGALSDGSSVVASGSADKTVRVWRAEDGVPVSRLRGDEPVQAIAIGTLPDGTPTVVTSSWAGVQVRRLHDGTRVSGVAHHPSARALAIGALRTGAAVVVSGGVDNLLRVWRLGTSQLEYGPIAGHNGSVDSVAIGTLADGTEVIVSAGRDMTVRVWRLQDGAPALDPITGHDGYVTSVATGTLPDGTAVIVSAGTDMTVRVWRLEDGAPAFDPITGHIRSVESVAVGSLSDGTPIVVSGSRDRTVRTWELETGRQIGRPLNVLSVPRAVAAAAHSVIFVATDNDVFALHRPTNG